MTVSEMPDRAPVVDVWRIALHGPTASVRDCLGLLDEKERQRAAAFTRLDDRLRFVVGRATLRLLIGRRLGMAPQEVVFDFNQYGKPLLPASQALHFNLAHAGSWVVLALSEHAPVGIDVEVLQTEAGHAELVPGALARAEQRWLETFDGSQRGEAFTRLWVCKEAYAKAIGEGLSRMFNQICIGQAAEQTPVIVHDQNPGRVKAGCSLNNFALPGHAGCVAYLGKKPSIRWHGRADLV